MIVHEGPPIIILEGKKMWGEELGSETGSPIACGIVSKNNKKNPGQGRHEDMFAMPTAHHRVCGFKS